MRRSQRIIDKERKEKEKNLEQEKRKETEKKRQLENGETIGEPDFDGLITKYIDYSVRKLLKKRRLQIELAEAIIIQESEINHINFEYGPKNFNDINTQINEEEIVFNENICIDDLIKVGLKYNPSVKYKCKLNVKKIHDIAHYLIELNGLIGLKTLKKKILDQLIYVLSENKKEKIVLHTCIYGGSGLGKTEIAKILCKIYRDCGILSNGEIIQATRADFIGNHLGSTTIKTQKLMERSKGNVLFIDEVYSMGPGVKDKDSFSKEAIDYLTGFLLENYKDFVCIIAGYKEDIEHCFFSVNQGLKRRFYYFYTIENYSYNEMTEMFKMFINSDNIKINVTDKDLEIFFKENLKAFPCYAGNLRTLVDKCKVNVTNKSLFSDVDYLTTDLLLQSFNDYMFGHKVQETNTEYMKMFL